MERRNVRIAVLVVVVAALAVALLLYLRGRGADDGAAEPSSPTARATPVVPAPKRMTARQPTAAPAETRTAPVRLTPAVAGEDPDAASGAFQGRVVSWGSGLGVPGAEVVFSGDQGASTIRTAADGGFVFLPPAEGTYRLAVASADGYLPYAPAWGRSPIQLVARAELRVKGIIVYLTPAVKYTGRVVDPDGKPVAGAHIKLEAAGGDERALVSIKDTFKSGAKGSFAFSAPDNSVLVATHPDHHEGRAVLDGAAQISHKLEIRLGRKAPPAVLTIAGRVVDPKGEPVAGAVVRAGTSGHGGGRAYRTLSATDGAFRFKRVEPGRYDVVATSDAWAPARDNVRAGVENLELKMSSGAAVRGRVVDESGAAVAAFTIVVLRRLGPMREQVVTSSSVFDAEGQFEVRNLEAGPYAVRAVAYGYPPAVAVDTKAVVAPQAPSPVTITMQRGGSLTGTVVDAESKAALVRAKVTVEGSVGSGPSALPLQSVAVTDEQGQFDLAGLPVGRASVVAAAADHHSRIAGGLVVTPGIKLGPIEIALTPVKDGERPTLELAGIGAALAARDDALVIQRIWPGSGAEAAGLKVGDGITAVDGTPVVKLGMQGAIQAIRGPVGTEVRLTVRKADGSVGDVLTTRKKIRA